MFCGAAGLRTGAEKVLGPPRAAGHLRERRSAERQLVQPIPTGRIFGRGQNQDAVRTLDREPDPLGQPQVSGCSPAENIAPARSATSSDVRAAA